MNNLEININEIECNGSTYIPNIQTNSQTASVQTAVSLYRMRYSDQEIFDTFPAGEDYYRGYRFTDDSTVAGRAVSAVLNYLQPKVPAENLQDEFNRFFENINGTNMDFLILDAFRDCAAADYYYEFEKEY